jgi:hypothetical protein
VAGGFEGEGQFGEFSAALGGELALTGGEGRGRPWARRWREARRSAFGMSPEMEKAHAVGCALNFFFYF